MLLSQCTPDNRAIVGWQSALLSTVCRSSIDSQVDQLSVYCLLTLHGQSSDGRSTVDQNLIDCAPTIDRLSINTWSTVIWWLMDRRLLTAKVHLVRRVHLYSAQRKRQWLHCSTCIRDEACSTLNVTLPHLFCVVSKCAPRPVPALLQRVVGLNFSAITHEQHMMGMAVGPSNWGRSYTQRGRLKGRSYTKSQWIFMFLFSDSPPFLLL